MKFGSVFWKSTKLEVAYNCVGPTVRLGEKQTNGNVSQLSDNTKPTIELIH